jgi:hypothetical protein
MRLHALLLALAAHLGSYLELGAAAAAEVRRSWIRRALLAVLAATACLAGAGALWLVGLLALWDTQWRLAYVVITAGLLLLAAAAATMCAVARRPAGPFTGVLQSELRKDVELFQEWKSTNLN